MKKIYIIILVLFFIFLSIFLIFNIKNISKTTILKQDLNQQNNVENIILNNDLEKQKNEIKPYKLGENSLSFDYEIFLKDKENNLELLTKDLSKNIDFLEITNINNSDFIFIWDIINKNKFTYFSFIFTDYNIESQEILKLINNENIAELNIEIKNWDVSDFFSFLYNEFSTKNRIWALYLDLKNYNFVKSDLDKILKLNPYFCFLVLDTNLEENYIINQLKKSDIKEFTIFRKLSYVADKFES